MSNDVQLHDVHLHIEYGKLSDVMDWCRSNCTGDWWVELSGDTHNPDYYSYIFQFSREFDVISFSLKYT